MQQQQKGQIKELSTSLPNSNEFVSFIYVISISSDKIASL